MNLKKHKSDVSLRNRLRQDTRKAHEMLDNAVGALDLSKYQDFCIYAQAHYAAYDYLHRKTKHQNGLMSHRRALALADLYVLGKKPKDLDMVTPQNEWNSDGLTYVIAGSHLGSKLLAKQWKMSTDTRVTSAHRLLTDHKLMDCWKMQIDKLSKMPASGSVADHAIDSAIACFAVFENAFNDAIVN